mmetsp:Transcript_79507/g.199925  ORF Transcript_79507/g.199925 Transcript_79507/m.199925 type:complete len:456 (-) Transcript_79507:136-1503(-)
MPIPRYPSPPPEGASCCSSADANAAVADLKEQAAALLTCLVASGALSMDRYQAELHRRRFAATKIAHPCSWNTTLAEVLVVPSDVLQRATAFAGLPSYHDLRCASPGIAKVIAEVAQVLNWRLAVRLVWKQYPPHRSDGGYMCGELDFQRQTADKDTGRAVEVAAAHLKDVQDVCMQLCICGGYDGTQSLSCAEHYNFASGVWQELPLMLQPRFGAAVAALDGSLYVCGGHDGQVALNTSERFDPAAGVWHALPASSQRRSRAVAAIMGRRLYVLGGHDGQETLSSAERFDPVTGLWDHLPPMSQRRRSAGAAAVGGGLYLCGGLDSEEPLRAVERFTPDGGWEELPPILQARYGAMTAAISGCIYICGGMAQEANAAERFDPAIGSWEVLPPMLRRRTGVAVAAAAGRLYVCGGYDGQQPLRDVEYFDPEVSIWKALPPMSQPRALAVASMVCI